jgi:hypothetical protein
VSVPLQRAAHSRRHAPLNCPVITTWQSENWQSENAR